MNQKTVILSCSSLKDYVEAAQRAVGTAFPVIYLNRVYHRDPQEMREHVLEEFGRLPEDVGTVLVSMGFCGGVYVAKYTLRGACVAVPPVAGQGAKRSDKSIKQGPDSVRNLAPVLLK